MLLYCIRHGHTTGDAENRYGGWYDDALSAEGEAQATALAASLQSIGLISIYCSSLRRAQQTAGYLAKATGAKLIARHDLRECNRYAALSGMEKSEAKQKHPDWVE
jgi:broad specificity phosphatase PhoE